MKSFNVAAVRDQIVAELQRRRAVAAERRAREVTITLTLDPVQAANFRRLTLDSDDVRIVDQAEMPDGMIEMTAICADQDIADRLLEALA